MVLLKHVQTLIKDFSVGEEASIWLGESCTSNGESRHKGEFKAFVFCEFRTYAIVYSWTKEETGFLKERSKVFSAIIVLPRR